MSYCDHCSGQRFDRARVLRVLRMLRRELRDAPRGAAAASVERALREIRALDIPHLETDEDLDDGTVH
jgi:hypothetical protein